MPPKSSIGGNRPSPFNSSCAPRGSFGYLKALLLEATIAFGKTHNLSLILDQLQDRHPRLELVRPTLVTLNADAVEYRYLGESADREVARQAVKVAEEVSRAVLSELGE